MAKDVTFSIRLTIDGKEKIVSATADVQHFAKAFEEAKVESTKARDMLIKFTQRAQSFQNVITGVQQLTGVIGQLTAAYAEEDVAATKLANNMENMMGAREDEIASIRELCAAQQELGVIGDEVQLAGAQEMATYLQKKSSLETLIPVMNDMLAQQYGLNATQEEAANIAMMLGKVMEGQTGALSRYGYYFDEAQEAILKYGTEEERAATLAAIVEDAVGGMNARLAETDAGKAKQLANNLGDIKEQIGALFISIEPTIVAIGELGLAVSGMMTAWNGLRGIVGMINLSAIATRSYAVAVRVLSAAQKEIAAVQLAWRRALIAWTFGAKTAAVGIVGLRVAFTALKAALMAGVIGLVLALVSGLVRLFTGSKDAAEGVDNLTEAEQRQQAVLQEEQRQRTETLGTINLHKKKLEELMEAQKHGVDTKNEEIKLVQELGQTYGDTMGYFSGVAEWYQALCANSEAYCQAMANEIRMRKLANEMAEIQELRNEFNNYYDTIEHIPGVQKGDRVVKETNYDRKALETYWEWGGTGIPGKLKVVYGTETRRKARLAALDKREDALIQEMNQMPKVRMLMMGRTTPPTVGPGTITPTGPGSYTGTPPLQLIADPQTRKDLKNNVRYYEQQLDKVSIKDTEAVANLYKLRREAQKAVDDFDKLGEVQDADPAEGSVDWYDQRLKDLRTSLRGEVNIDNIDNAQGIIAQINEYEKNKEKLEQLLGLKEQEPQGPTEGSAEWKRERYEELSTKAQQVQQDYEIGIKGKQEALDAIKEINTELEKLGLKPITVDVVTEDIDKAKQKTEGAYAAVSQMGSALQGFGNALELPELSVAGVLAQAIVTMIRGYAQATAEANDLGPWAWIAFAATGLAQLTAMISSVKGMAKFADGGIVSGTTLALVGEYAGASNNPEVIAPLDKLRNLIGTPAQAAGVVRFEIKGRSLQGVLHNEAAIGRKSGRK